MFEFYGAITCGWVTDDAKAEAAFVENASLRCMGFPNR